MIELAPMFSPELTYDEAWLYCATLEHNGHKDWRLPIHEEWNNKHKHKIFGWYENATSLKKLRIVCPVRDI